MEPVQPAQPRASPRVHDFDGIVPQGGDEQPPARNVHGQVIDAAFDAGQRDHRAGSEPTLQKSVYGTDSDEQQDEHTVHGVSEQRQARGARCYCFSYTATLFTCCPAAFVPVVVTVLVLPSADTTDLCVRVTFPAFF